MSEEEQPDPAREMLDSIISGSRDMIKIIEDKMAPLQSQVEELNSLRSVAVNLNRSRVADAFGKVLTPNEQKKLYDELVTKVQNLE